MTETITRRIDPVDLGYVRHRVAELNERVARHGMENPVAFTVGEVETNVRDDGTVERWVDVTITATPPAIPGGWTLAAVADWTGTDEALVFNVADDIDLRAADFDRARCDHCEARRRRNRVFALRAEDGRLVHVGTTCLHDFLGHDVAALLYFPELLGELEEEEWAGGGGGAYGIGTLDFVAAARAAVLTWGWAPAAALHSTRAAVAAIFGPHRDADEDDLRAARILAFTDPAVAAYAVEVVEWAAGLEPRNDFEENLRTVARSEVLGHRAFGIAAYLSVAYARHLDADAERRAREAARPPAQPVPEGRVEVTGEVIGLSEQYSDYGVTHRMTVRDDRGFRVWGTVPRAILDEVDRGTRVAFIATLERSDDDETFGFAKRPTKAQVLEAAA